MATEVKQKQVTGETPEKKTSEEKAVETAKHFWERNSKFITYVVAALVLVVGGWFVYKNYFVAPEEQKATELIWKAQSYFAVDSFAKALNGDGQTQGFLRVISRHGGTKTGNLAKFYAGVCYMKLGDFNNAIKYLKDFSTDKVALQQRATGLLGDAYSVQGKKQEAVDYYTKAGNLWEQNELDSPEYLYRAAQLNQELGKNKEAIEQLKKIKENYPNFPRVSAGEIDKYLGKLGELN